MHRQLNHVWRSRRLVLFADVSRVTAPRRLSTSQRESTRRSAALIYFRLKPPRLLFSPGFVPTLYVGTTWTEKTRVVQETTGRRMINWGSFLREERRRKSLSPPSRANLFTYDRAALEGESDFSSSVAFLSGDVSRMRSLDSLCRGLNGDLSATDSWQWWMPIQEELETGSRIRPRQVITLA